MAREKFNVLIIDDDQNFGRSLVKALMKRNIIAQHVNNPEAAQTICQHEDFKVLVADCMLPRLDGVTLVQNLKQNLSYSPYIVIMTGVFKDKGFLKEAQNRTGAGLVLSKPFDLNAFISHIEELKGEEHSFKDTSLPSTVLEVLSLPNPTIDHLSTFLAEPKSLDGRELPFLISLACQLQVSGAFYVLLPQGQSGTIYLKDGVIEHAHLDDAKSFLGHILMDLGYLEPEDLEAGLKSSEAAPLGQRLIQQMSISPHAVDLALIEQSIIRLSQLVVSDMVEVQFSPRGKSPLKGAQPISEKRLNQLFREWSESKFDDVFLEQYFGEALNSPYDANSEQAEKFDGGKTLKATLSSLSFNEVAFHVLTGNLKPNFAQQGPRSKDWLMEKLGRLYKNMKAQNDFQVLGVTNKANSAEIRKAYNLLLDSLKQNSDVSNNDSEVVELHSKILSRLHRAYENLKDDASRSQYQRELGAKHDLELLKRQPEFTLAVDLMGKRDYSKSLELLRRLKREGLKFRDLDAYLLIAERKATKINVRDEDLLKISPENRHSVGYLIARGLAEKGKKKYEMAIQSFKKALVYEPSSRIAKHEIRSCIRRLERREANESLFSLGGIFSKSGRKTG